MMKFGNGSDALLFELLGWNSICDKEAMSSSSGATTGTDDKGAKRLHFFFEVWELKIKNDCVKLKPNWRSIDR